jgi:GTPase
MSLLLRLPPLNVSLTPEVRCAVVGNVDSGKSTTLGVLTRGMLFNRIGEPIHPVVTLNRCA